MGLPLFITPVEPEVAAKAAEKMASAQRSSIRRNRIRSMPRNHPALGRMSSEARRRWMLESILNTEVDREPSEPRHESPPSQNAPNSFLDPHSRTVRMFEAERMRLRDTLFERRPDIEIDGPLMPPAPESRDYRSYTGSEERRREIQRLRQVGQDIRRMTRRHPAPTPPYQESDYSHVAGPITGIDTPQSASLTPALSPAPFADDNESLNSARRVLEDYDRLYASRGPPEPTSALNERLRSNMHDRVGSALSERVRALSRASNNMERSRRLLRQARLDGLGDRDRSLSPENGAAWDTLLTGITPDPQPPSAASSFASNSAAAATNSTGSGPSTASTSMTSLGRPEASQMNDSADADAYEQHVIDCLSDSSSAEDEEEDVYELRGLNRTQAPWRSYAEVVTPNEPSRHGSTPDAEELGGWHRIISRLTERDDIPDEWWASAGLIRNLRREPTN